MAICTPPEELIGYGTLLQYQDPLTEDWVTVSGTRDLELPNDTTDDIETTSGVGGGYRTYRPNPLATLEPVTYEMMFLWSQWNILWQMKTTRVFTQWRLVLTNEEQSYMQFCAYISGLGGTIPMEDLVMSSITLRPSGAPTWDTLI